MQFEDLWDYISDNGKFGTVAKEDLHIIKSYKRDVVSSKQCIDMDKFYTLVDYFDDVPRWIRKLKVDLGQLARKQEVMDLKVSHVEDYVKRMVYKAETFGFKPEDVPGVEEDSFEVSLLLFNISFTGTTSQVFFYTKEDLSTGRVFDDSNIGLTIVDMPDLLVYGKEVRRG